MVGLWPPLPHQALIPDQLDWPPLHSGLSLALLRLQALKLSPEAVGPVPGQAWQKASVRQE